jgi:hypothetical protein
MLRTQMQMTCRGIPAGSSTCVTRARTYVIQAPDQDFFGCYLYMLLSDRGEHDEPGVSAIAPAAAAAASRHISQHVAI